MEKDNFWNIFCSMVIGGKIVLYIGFMLNLLPSEPLGMTLIYIGGAMIVMALFIGSIWGAAKRDRRNRERERIERENFIRYNIQSPKKRAELKSKLPNIENLIDKMQFSNAAIKLRDIGKIAEQYNLFDILSWVEKNLNICETHIIKKTVLNLGTKFGRLQVKEIAEECGVENDLIVATVKEMIENKEIYAKYFESSKSVAFNQQANIDEIDKLMSAYKDWEDKKLGKK